MTRLDVAELVRLPERHGYALLFFWVLAEQGALPIPSLPLLLAVGALVHTGHLNAATAVACCLAGALVADIVWFYFARIRGKRVLRFLCRISLEPDSCVSQTENAFLKRGLKMLLIAKFVPGLNAVAAPLAGDSGVGVARFLACDALGIVIWSGAYLTVGYLFSDQVEEVLGYAQRLGSGTLFLLVALWHWVRYRSLYPNVQRPSVTGYSPAITFTGDRHLAPAWLLSNVGTPPSITIGPGVLVFDQTEVFQDFRTGVVNIPVMNSGFTITQAVTLDASSVLHLTTSKTGAAVAANGFSSSAGSVTPNTSQLNVITVTQP